MGRCATSFSTFLFLLILPPSPPSLRENRYLLFLTENYAALQVLKRYLQEVVGLNSTSGHVAGAGGLEGPGVEEGEEGWGERSLRGARKMEPFILFGSSFPKDKEYTQVCGLIWCTASLTHSYSGPKFCIMQQYNSEVMVGDVDVQ